MQGIKDETNGAMLLKPAGTPGSQLREVAVGNTGLRFQQADQGLISQV